MPKIIYETFITKIGKYVPDMLSENIIILFKENAPDELAEYCILHSGNRLDENIAAGDEVQFMGENFKITAVGELVNKNLTELGHITIKFDGSSVAELPGSLHVEKKAIPNIPNGDGIIRVVRR